MRILSLETSSSVSGLAVCEDATVLAENSLVTGSVYVESLPELIQHTLNRIDLPIESIDAYALSIGPGSYTGLRVGLSLIKGLAYVTRKPVAAVPSLDVLAYGLPYSRYPVCAMIDARRGQVFSSLYATSDGQPERLTPYGVFSVEEALEQVEGTVVCAGNGAGAYRDRIQDTLGERAVFPPDGIARLNAASVGFMGMAMIHRGQYAALYELEPLYIRRPQYTRLSATESAV